MNSTSKDQDEMKILKSMVLTAENLEFKTLFVKVNVLYFIIIITIIMSCEVLGVVPVLYPSR
jgi:hypothetical protein